VEDARHPLRGRGARQLIAAAGGLELFLIGETLLEQDRPRRLRLARRIPCTALGARQPLEDLPELFAGGAQLGGEGPLPEEGSPREEERDYREGGRDEHHRYILSAPFGFFKAVARAGGRRGLCHAEVTRYRSLVAKWPNITLSVKRLIRDVAHRLPEFAHVRAGRMLVVAGEARGTSRASVGPGKVGPASGRRRRFIRVRGRSMLYVVTLRPLWFLASSPEERVATILHELYHVSTRFDGSLHRGRRHAKLPRRAYDRKVNLLLGRYLARAPEEVLAPFAREGVVKVLMWLRLPRPRRAGGRAALDVDAHLFHAYMPLAARPPRGEDPSLDPDEKTTTGVKRGEAG